MTKRKTPADATVKRYLVTKPTGITTGSGHVAAGDYVTHDDLAGSVRRMLRTGAVVDLEPGVPATAGAGNGTARPDPAPPSTDDTLSGRLTREAAAADLPTLAADSDADGVVAQTIPVVLRFLAAHPHRGGDILSAERTRAKPRRSVLDAAREAANATKGARSK